MKLYLIVVLLFSVVYNDCEREGVSKASDCNGNLSEDDKKLESVRCCYLKADSEKYCVSLNQKEFDDIDGTIKKFKNDIGKDIDDLDCLSLYLKLGFLSILSLIL